MIILNVSARCFTGDRNDSPLRQLRLLLFKTSFVNDSIITVENLSKRYRLGVIGATTLRDSVQRTWHRLRGRDWRHHMGEVGRAETGRLKAEGGTSDSVSSSSLQVSGLSPQPSPDEIWALRDVSFEVKHGEVLGIIGKNGAGKSTLLKILSRITDPTSGRAMLRGRVGSLLEVGTGFHPELTGRENVFLNGSILGMKRSEIRSRFDEIVDFSGVETFIDTPVKRYSSGWPSRWRPILTPRSCLWTRCLLWGMSRFRASASGR